jgi:hypothetical protein
MVERRLMWMVDEALKLVSLDHGIEMNLSMGPGGYWSMCPYQVIQAEPKLVLAMVVLTAIASWQKSKVWVTSESSDLPIVDLEPHDFPDYSFPNSCVSKGIVLVH